MMWLCRRWVEFMCLAVSMLALLDGAYMPPPVGNEFAVKGRVERAEFAPDSVSFVVGSTTFATSAGDPGYEQLRRALKDGASVDGIAWRDTPWLDDKGAVIEMSVDGVSVITRASRLGAFWLRSLIFLFFGALGAWVALMLLKLPTPLWLVYLAKREAAASARARQNAK